MGKKLEIFLVYLKLGLTSFGGPVAHLGYFREEFIVKRKWLKEQGYADVVALCQFLPGPTSSQVGFVIGLLRGGISGGLIAWLAFTGPSVLLMFCFVLLLNNLCFLKEACALIRKPPITLETTIIPLSAKTLSD